MAYTTEKVMIDFNNCGLRTMYYEQNLVADTVISGVALWEENRRKIGTPATVL